MAELDALVDIMSVDAVVPLDAVQKGSNADQQRVEDDHRTSRKERTKQVVPPVADTSQECDCRPSPEKANSRIITFRWPTLPMLMRARTGTTIPQPHNAVRHQSLKVLNHRQTVGRYKCASDYLSL